MQDYLYDGTFEGFLTCVYHHYYTEPAAGICLKEEYQSSLLGGFQESTRILKKLIGFTRRSGERFLIWICGGSINAFFLPCPTRK